jgi:hypothetical protein
LGLRRKAEQAERGSAKQLTNAVFHRSLLQSVSMAIFLISIPPLGLAT